MLAVGEGASEEERNFIRNLSIASVAAFFLIYALIAVPLHSYGQPLIIMSVIPFGFIGAVFGHIIMGKAISMFSMFGLIALAGVVVNACFSAVIMFLLSITKDARLHNMLYWLMGDLSMSAPGQTDFMPTAMVTGSGMATR